MSVLLTVLTSLPFWIFVIVLLVLILLPQFVARNQQQKYNKLKTRQATRQKEIRATVIDTADDGVETIRLTTTDSFVLTAKLYPVNQPKALVQMIHGVLEHKGRYEDFIRYLNKQGYAVIISDTRGHGESTNPKYPHISMDLVDELVDDQVLISHYIKQRFPKKELYLFGHSLGSMIARNYLQKHDKEIQKLALTGTVMPYPLAPVGVFLARIIVFYFGKYGHNALLNLLNPAKGDQLDWISYNPKNLDAIAKDPLCQHRLTNIGILTMFDINARLKQVQRFDCQNPHLQILSATGIDDTLITGGEKGLEETMSILREIGYSDITNIVYPDMKHEVLQEENKQQVYQDIVDFFEQMGY